MREVKLRDRAHHGSHDRIVLFVRDFHHAWTFDLEAQFESLLYRLEGPVICEGETGLVRSIFDHEAWRRRGRHRNDR